MGEQKIEKTQNSNNTFYFFLLAYILALFTIALIFRPFFYSIVLGIVLGVFFYPLNKILKNKGFNPKATAIILVLIIFFLIIGSSYLFANSIVTEATQTYNYVAQYNFTEADQFVESYIGLNISTKAVILQPLENINQSLTQSILDLLGSIADILLGLFIMLFLLYYFFKDGEKILNNIMELIPFSEKHRTRIKEESRKVLYGVMYGQVLIGIIQGIIGGFAFYIFGLNSPVFWGFIMGILALIPILGTPLIWIPAGILQIVNGSVLAGIGLLLFGSVIMFSIENIVRPRYIGKKSGLHPIIVILSIFGGIKFFGLIGLIIGPILVAICVLIIKIFTQEIVKKSMIQNNKTNNKLNNKG